MSKKMFLFFYEEQAHMNEVFVALFNTKEEAENCKTTFDKVPDMIPNYFPDFSYVADVHVANPGDPLEIPKLLQKHANL